MKKPFISLLSMVLCSCIVPDSMRDHQEFISNEVLSNPDISQHYITTDVEGVTGHKEFRLHFRQAGRAEEGIAIWIHGTPGGWADSGRLLVDSELTDRVLMVSIDRPGWGESQFIEHPDLVTSFLDQAILLDPLLNYLTGEFPDAPILLIGHSWGASVAPAIALAHPDKIDGVIMAAGGLDPELAAPRWYNRLGNTLVAQAFLGNAMEAANEEVYALKPQLESYQSRWSELDIPAIYIQAENDQLVDPKHADFAAHSFRDIHVLRLANQGHLLQMERTDLLAICIRAMLKNDTQSCEDNR